MAQIDLRKFALRLKVIEVLRLCARQRRLAEAPHQWRLCILPN